MVRMASAGFEPLCGSRGRSSERRAAGVAAISMGAAAVSERTPTLTRVSIVLREGDGPPESPRSDTWRRA